MNFHLTHTRLLATSAIALSLVACGGGTGDNNAVTGSQLQPPQQGSDNTALRPDRIPLIVGGSVVNHSRYPWMVALVSASDADTSSGQFCGGSLIADNWVLTAAHCVEEETARSTDVLIGQRDLRDNNGERIGASRIIIHPDYRSLGYPDLALVELESSSNAQVITLPSRNNPAPNDGELATVTGWGQVSETGPATDLLRETTLPIVDHDTCNRAYNNEIDRDSMVCAGTPSGDKDSCYGDSGGPLFVKRNDDYVQAGVVSFGEECGLANVPGVYARVSSYYDWISGYATVKAYNSDNSDGGNNNGGNNTDEEDSNDDTTDNGNDNNTGNNNEDSGNDTDNTFNSDNYWSFDSDVSGWFEEIYLPEDGSSLQVDDGVLTVELTTDSTDPVIVFIDEYDEQHDEWYTLTGEVSRNGVIEMEIEVSAGEYGFSVLSLGDGGTFTLNASLEP